MIPPLPSTIVATVFITFLTILSCVQFRRSHTPLRLGAAVMALFGLSISALSIVYATDSLSLSVFWVYQFVAECIAVTWVIVTIIHLGYAFYPLTRHQTVIWRTALGSVILYDTVAISELCYYCYAVWGSGSLAKEATPILWIYWTRQMVKILACAVTITYLFVPLVRHHHSTGVAMIADSNTLAVGTWYLSALGITSLGYLAMSIYYMTRGKEVFSPQAQALDLCIRLTSCPIFSLPPPQILIKYFRSKYGSAVRDDNPNTMIEEGITNDPRPRRPVMLVSQPTSHSSRRDSDYVFGSAYQERHQNIYSSYSSFEGDDDRCKHYIEEEANIGTNSSLDTAAETSPKLKPLSKLSSSNLKESKTPMSANMDETVLPPLCISIPSEMPSIPNSEEVIITTHPLSFAPGVVHERNEEDETAIAARRISRRLTMEGRKDDLDILNITGLMKRSHRPHSTEPGLKPATSMASLRSTRSSHPPLPTLMSETNFNPSRKPSVLRRGKLSVISDSSMASEEDVMRHETILSRGLDIQTAAMKASEQEQGQGQEKTSDKLPTQTSEHDTQMDTSSNNTALHHPIICENESHINPSSDIASLENKDEHPSDNSPIPISRKVSMNNIRRMSRDAITRFQEGAFAAALSASAATTGPLSLTILRTERNNNNADSAGDRSKKSKAQLKEDHVEHAHLLPT